MTEPGTARIGIFNAHWKAFGGGEQHALNIASALSGFGPVDLIAHGDFDVEELGQYFDMDTSMFRKKLVSSKDRKFSEGYDIFVNASFNSRHASRAPVSLYVLYFPFERPRSAFLRSYTFLPISAYTMKWLELRWGEGVKAEVLYPAARPGEVPNGISKLRSILSIGRFTPSGNSKKQLEMVDTFRALRERHPGARDWRLTLIGSLNRDIDENVAYLRHVEELAAGLPVEVLPNAPSGRVRQALAEASVFWHFAGLGEDAAETPERLEHFGIVVVEAMMHGCWPIVFNGGGPREIIESGNYGETANDREELVEKTAAAIRRFDRSERRAAPERETLAQFTQERLRARLAAIIAAVGGPAPLEMT